MLDAGFTDNRDRLLRRIRSGKLGVIADISIVVLALIVGVTRHTWFGVVFAIVFVICALIQALDVRKARASLKQSDEEIAGLTESPQAKTEKAGCTQPKTEPY